MRFTPRSDTLDRRRVLLGVAGLCLAVATGLALGKPFGIGAAAADAAKPRTWVVAAPGRVEPKGGMVRVGTAIVGRILEVHVELDAEVEAGELVLQLDDAEARARLAAAETIADVREKTRDDGDLSSKRRKVRDAEDEVYRAERAVTGARIELDYALAGRRKGTVDTATLANARNRLTQAEERLRGAQIRVAQAQVEPDLPAPSAAEAAVIEARAEVSIAEAMLDKTRIRAPRSGRVLILRAKSGEMVAPSPDAPLLVIGDMSGLEVTAEVDEADVAKVAQGQRAYVTSLSYPDRRFSGKVVRVAPALAEPVIKQRGARRPTDIEVLEVTIALDGDVPLLPGMRVDAFFRE